LSHITCRGLRPQGGDRCQQLTAMADKGNTQFLEVVGRQFAQDLAIYRVIV
jgi:hypothetical protein